MSNLTSRRATATVCVLVGLVVGLLVAGRRSARDERGLSQSTENAILLAGAVAVAAIVIAAIKVYVEANLPK